MLIKHPFLLKMTLLFMFSFTILHGDRLCRAQVDCLPDYDGKTITVGYNTVMLSEVLEHCSPIIVHEEDTIPDTISLFIIIDQSGSMSIMDSTSIRYKGARDLIDAVAKESPKSEIGIAVFSNKLLHNVADDPFFKELANTKGWNDSYVPLTGLDTQVGGMSAVDKLKWAIKIDPSKKDLGNNYTLVNGNYGNSGRKIYSGQTDISLAFEAAKEAFKSSKYSKKRHYIVLFSDGISQNVDTERAAAINDYIDGKNTPATFTAFFVLDKQPIPAEIKNMTNNIKTNGYSNTNILSEVWKAEGQISLFFGKILGSITGGVSTITSTPISMVANGVETTTFDADNAYFDAPFCAFDKNGELTIKLEYKYHWNKPKDTDETKNFTIKIKQGVDPEVDSVNCWEQGTIHFYHDGIEITNARPDQLKLTVRYYPPEESTAPPVNNTFSLEITNSDKSDKITLPMKKKFAGYFEAGFTREYATPISGDAILQNFMKDSIVGVYQNPDIPLDVVHYSIPVQAKVDMTVMSCCYLDNDANGQPDIIRVIQQGGKVNTAEECKKIKSYMDILGPRNVDYAESVVPGIYGFNIIIKEPTGQPFTGLYYKGDGSIDEQVKIDKVKLASGQSFPNTNVNIQDSMAPVVLYGVYCPGYTKNEGQLVQDTLIVTFAEPVKTPTDKEPFKFYDSENKTNNVSITLEHLFKNDAAEQVFLVTNKTSGWRPKAGDSLWITHTAGVIDLHDNDQENENNHKGPIRIKPYQFNIDVSVAPNPSLPDDLAKVLKIDGLDNSKNGLVIKAKVVGPWTSDVTLNGTVVIYDAVGNIVSTIKSGVPIDDSEKKDKIKETVVFVWNGENDNERLVGGGTYRAIVTIKSSQGYQSSQQVMIGIKTGKSSITK